MTAVTAAAATEAVPQSLSRGTAKITVAPISADMSRANPGSW